MAGIFRKAWRRFGSSAIRDGRVCSGKSSGGEGTGGADEGVGCGPGGPAPMRRAPPQGYKQQGRNAETNLGAAGTTACATSDGPRISVCGRLLRLIRGGECSSTGDFLSGCTAGAAGALAIVPSSRRNCSDAAHEL